MPKKDLPCSLCGDPMWRDPRFSLPEGQATCLVCRRQRKAAAARRQAPELRFCAICQDPFEAKTANQTYCSTDCRNSRRGWTYQKPATANERGYGKEHREARAEWKRLIDSQGGIDCCLCGEWIDASERWHLDHTPERDGYRGAAHPLCNVRDGASRGARRSNAGRAYVKACATCGQEFGTSYPKQTYCSVGCRPKRRATPKPKREARRCSDCGAQIARGARCKSCGVAHSRMRSREHNRKMYRARVGIPIDAPLIKSGRPRAA